MMDYWIFFGFFILFGFSLSSDATKLNHRHKELSTHVNSHQILRNIVKESLINFKKGGKIDPLLIYVTKQLMPFEEFSDKPFKMTSRTLNKQSISSTIPHQRLCSLGLTIQSLNDHLKKLGACGGCLLVADTIAKENHHPDFLVKVFTEICYIGHFQPKPVCAGLVKLNMDIILYIFKQKKSLILEEACSIILQDRGCFKDHRPQWTVSVPPGNSPHRFSNDRPPSHKKNKILQFTDIHIDLMYGPGANADCAEILCCQKGAGNCTIPAHRAGQWGDYRNCDMPFYSFVNTLDQIVANHPKLSYVYVTGDIISHHIWATSKESNTNLFRRFYELLYNKFGKIPIYPILGNHESHPLNVFSPHSITDENLSTQWLFKEAAEKWSHWLPKETQNTILHGGYYTVLVKPGFRIIALNSNVCFIYNWWLLYDNKDPYGQLQWLTKILTQAEANNESVHILSHIPPGDNTCLQEWTRQFHRIVERFANTITGQFNGHTHFVEWRVFYNSSNPSQAINVAYIGGSFTTYNNLNPNYRFYDVDSETHEVIDYQDWTYKVDQANRHPSKPPNWYEITSFKRDYQVKSLKPKDVGELVSKMAKNTKLAKEYYRFKTRDSTPAMKQGCDDHCVTENWCSLVSTKVGITNYAYCEPFL